jgi:hypothetical protein
MRHPSASRRDRLQSQVEVTPGQRERAESCHHQADAALGALVASGRGGVPLTELRFRCSQCDTDRIDFVVTSRDNPHVVRGGDQQG